MVATWLDFRFLCFLSSHPLTLLTSHFLYPPPSLPPPFLHTVTRRAYSLGVVKQEIYLSIYLCTPSWATTPAPSHSPRRHASTTR